MSKQDDVLYRLLRGFATVEQLREALRPYKQTDPEAIKLSATKEHLLEDMRRGVTNALIPPEVPQGLLQDFEENGDQHIFYFQPIGREALAICQDGEQVSTKLFGKDWSERMGFPRIAEVPDGYVDADFRIGLPGKPNDWLFKIYGYHTYEKRLSQQESTVGDQRFIDRRFLVQTHRSVLSVRWNVDTHKNRRLGLLEFRVSRDQRPRRVPTHRHMLRLRLVKVGLTDEDLKPFDLRPVMERMVRSAASHTDIYSPHDARVEDSTHGDNTFSPHGDDEPVHGNAARFSSICQFLDEGGRMRSLIACWLPAGSGGK